MGGGRCIQALIASAILLAIAGVSGRRLRFGGTWGPLAVVGATTVAGQLIGLSYASP
jgi:hypothetical protein